MRMLNGKKGFFDDWGDFFFSSAFFFIVFFFLMFADNASTEALKLEANADIIKLDASQQLITFLRSPVEYNDRIITVSDLMVLHARDRDDLLQLKAIEKKAKEFFREDAFVRFADNYGIEVCRLGAEDCGELAAAYLPDYNKIRGIKVTYKGPK